MSTAGAALSKSVGIRCGAREGVDEAKPWAVSEGLWERVEPLLPRKPRRVRYPGRKPFDDRLALQGISFVLHTGIGWELFAGRATELAEQRRYGRRVVRARLADLHAVTITRAVRKTKQSKRHSRRFPSS